MPRENPYFRSRTRRYPQSRYSFANIYGFGLSESRSNSDVEFATYESLAHGGSMPGWKKAIKDGVSATTVLQGQKVLVKAEMGGLTWRYSRLYEAGVEPFPFDDISGGSEMYGCIVTPMNGPGYVVSQVDYTKALNQALSRALQDIHRAQVSFEGGVFLGELKETVQMIVSPLKGLRKGLGSYLTAAKKRRRNASPAAKRRILSDTWLEYSYGWKPLIHDIDDGVDALNDLTSEPIPAGFKAYRGTGRDEWVGDIGSKSETVGGTTVTWRVMRREKVDVRVYGGMRNKILAEVGTLEKIGLGMNNFVPTLWELIPYSFLVDYFSNVGDIISALSVNTSAVSWINIGTLYEVEEYTYGNHVVVTPGTPAPGYRTGGGGNPGSFRWQARTVSRAPYLGSLVPSLEFEVPPTGSLKWLNIAALLSQHQSILPY